MDERDPLDAEEPATDPAEDVQAAFKAMVQDAVAFDQSDLAPDRAKATRYYKGEPFGDEEDGRSKVVLTDVRNGTLATLDSLMPVFFGAERVVEFQPRGPEDDAHARQMTDYVNYVITEDNNGFLTCWEAWKDALVRKRGVIKYWWEEGTAQVDQVEGLTEDQVALLKQDGVDIRITGQTTLPDGTVTVAAAITQIPRDGRARIMAVPPEEFLHSRDARTLADATAVFHRRDMSRSDLLALGIPADVLEEHGTSANKESSDDVLARSPKGDVSPSESGDDSNTPILYIEGYVKLGGKHRRICAIGEGCHIVHDDPWPDRPFALYVPDPEPHTLVGGSLADVLMPVQNVKSHVMRYTLDSAARTLFPRTAIDENKVNLADAQNTENGATVRTRGDPRLAMMEMAPPFIGAQMFTLLDYFDSLKEQSTGQTKASAGLDPDALQSSTRTAVEATVQAAQKRMALLCRIFAETGHKQLMRGVARLLHKHQPSARMVRLRNEWVAVDPRSWDPEQDMTVSVALGTGQIEHRMQVLYGIAAKQEQMLQLLGPSNPACGLPMLLNTYAEILELNGKKNTERYFAKLPADWQPPPSPPKKSPEEVLADIEQMKVQADIAIRQADQALKREQMLLQDDRERDKMRMDAFLRAFELEHKTNTQIDKHELDRLLGLEQRVEQSA